MTHPISESPAKIQRVGSYAFITAENHVLLSLLNRGPNRGKWSLIGGGIEFGESPREALIREVLEEAGIVLSVEPVLLDVFSHSYDDFHFIGIIHEVKLPKLIPCKADGDGFSSDGTKWFPLIEVQEVSGHEWHPSVLKVVKLLQSKKKD